MGLLDSIQNTARDSMAAPSKSGLDAATNARVAGGLMQALDEHPGGLSGILDHLRNNGMEQQVQQWSGSQNAGETQAASPDQIRQGLSGSGLIDRVAEKAGVSPQVAEMAVATILPIVISHFSQGGQATAPQGGFGGLTGQILGRLL